MSLHVLLTLGIFALTLFLILRKPNGLSEAWGTIIGAALVLLCQLTNISEASKTIFESANVLFFLLALMLLSALLDKAGFFDWAAIVAARNARGNAHHLYRNLFLLGAITTAILSLDTTAIILTPIVVASVQRLKLKAYPFLIACAFVANTGSLLFPISNLTNLLFQQAFQFSFIAFTLFMMVPQMAALAANYGVFVLLFKKDIPKDFDITLLPEPISAVSDKPFFIGAIAVLGLVIVGYFVASLQHIHPVVVASIGSAILLSWGLMRKQIDATIVKEISWSVFPFVMGLFVVVKAIENIGMAEFAADLMKHAQAQNLLHVISIATATSLGSNLINNIPMALLSVSILKHAHAGQLNQYAALLGCNIGPNLTITGSLATMLVITSARKRGEDVSAMDFAKVGLISTPFIVIAASVALFATSYVIK